MSTDMDIAERAAAWLATLERGGHKERAAFAAWLKESPRHVEEALFAAAVAQELSGLDRERRIDIQALLTEHSRNVVPLETVVPGEAPSSSVTGKQSSRSMRWTLAAGVAALLVGLSMAWWWWQIAWPGGWQSYQTAIGEQRIVELQDGSLAYLNTQSHLKVRFGPAARDVRLIEGETLFKVQRDPARPFRVLAQGTVIQALGTQFNVYQRAGQVTVSVIEGLVQVSPVNAAGSAPAHGAVTANGVARLAAGEQMLVTPGGKTARQESADIERAVAWRQRRLIFDADTLEDIATEFNRYNRASQIVIEDDAARQARFTGVFDADDPESLVQLLQTDHELEFRRRAGKLVIRSR